MQNLQPSFFTDAYKSKVMRLKLEKDTLQHQVYLLSLTKYLKIILPKFEKTYMLLMYYLSIRGKDLPDYSKNSTWNLLHLYIDLHCQNIIDEYPGYGVQAISIFKYQCADMTFYDKSIYNRTFQKVIHK